MSHTLTCPVCGEAFERVLVEPPNYQLLAHIWAHLTTPDTTHHNGARVCWCGHPFGHFAYFKAHMAAVNVQAHYAECLLGLEAHR
jgi:hypothetical protein